MKRRRLLIRLKSLAMLSALAVGTQLTACGPKLQPQQSCNFVQNADQQRVSWKQNLPIPIWINDSVPTQYQASILQAMAQWEYTVGKKLFSVQGIDHETTSPAQDGKNVIYWITTGWDTAKVSTEQARTTIFWQDNVIQEADILVNAQGFKLSAPDAASGQVDFQSLILHELGHVLGLQHDVVPGSVMAAYLSDDTERRTPSDFDHSSLTCEY